MNNPAQTANAHLFATSSVPSHIPMYRPMNAVSALMKFIVAARFTDSPVDINTAKSPMEY